ncbi:MAG: hypothetical protein EXR72_04455 [Myxococcales bacterium]|nr:hypothetical protein [Myxococcales bacterium]
MGEPSQFLVAVCQIGAEGALKREVAREHPDLRSAFARPGLVTWKSAGVPVGPGFVLRAVFARAYAVALGPARDVAEVLAAVERVGAERLRLHVWERDARRPGEESVQESPRAGEVRGAFLAAFGARFRDGEVAEAGEHVLDVVVAGDEPWFLGHHLHSPLHSPWPGGRIPVAVPENSPSRAYRKIEEAIAWSGAPLRRGEVAVEIGSAPGGASHALLRRGLEVVGIDTGTMAEVVIASPRFRHVQAAVGQVQRDQLPPCADWLLLDVNLAPQVALHAVRGIVAALRPSLRGVLFTLKLNDWGMADQVPDLLRRVEGMGITDVRATQLPSNRQEIFVYGQLAGPTGKGRRGRV